MKSIDIYGDGIGKVEYIEHMGNDKTIVQSARVSFGKDDATELTERDIKLVDYLIRNKHTSTLEHCNITFKFVVPLFVRSQHHRHRTWSYNEWSNRYRDLTREDNKPLFYEPKEFRTQHKSNRQASNAEELINPWVEEPDQWIQGRRVDDAVKDHHQESVNLYNKLMELGVCREQARGVLPQNLYTSYYGTTSLLNALKFIDLRDHEGAQYEIQVVAKAMNEILTDLYPITMAAYNIVKAERNNH
jgi:thymidylate synthase (FAD)